MGFEAAGDCSVKQQLSLSARPKTLDQLLGQDKLVAGLRGHAESGRVIKAWMLTGPKGTGKTTTARILALSLQCTHQKKFGNPCVACRRNKAAYPIIEINGAEITGKEDIRKAFEGADYAVMGAGAYRVYIVDEAHQLSKAAQNLALKYLEDSPDTTVFILCSTEPRLIIETLRSRCQIYQLHELEPDNVVVLVQQLLTKVSSELPADRLAEALNEMQVWSPRLIAQAVEKYCAGASPDEAAQVEGATEVDTYALTRSLMKGDWPGVATFMLNAQRADARAIRVKVIAYLRVVLLESAEISKSTKVVAAAITTIANAHNIEDSVMASVVAAELYKCCEAFSVYKH